MSYFNQLMIKSLRDSLDVLEKENAALKIQCEKVKLLARQCWNDGLLQGQSNAKRCYEDAAKAKDEYLTENERLTNMLLKVEEERDALRDRIDGGIRVHASMHEGGFLFVDQWPDSPRFPRNASIVFDERVNLDA